MRVLVATAIALLAMMMSRSCVADPNQDAAAATEPPLPQSERELQLELEDNEDFDLINMAQRKAEDEPDYQLTKVDAEAADSSTFQPSNFATTCSRTKSTSTCISDVKFYAMKKVYTMKVKVLTYYYSSTNRLYFILYVNNKYIGNFYVSAAEDKVQRHCKLYTVSGVSFEFCLYNYRMYTDMNHGGRRCSFVQIKSSNKVWANTARKCISFH